MNENELYEGDELEKAADAGKTLKRFIASLGKQRLRLLVVLISVAAYSVLNILSPIYSADAVDAIWNRVKELRAVGQSFSITWEYGGRQIVILLCVYMAAAVFYILQNFLISSFAEKLNYQTRGEIAEKLHRLPLSYFDRHQTGEVMSRATNDLDKVSEVLQTGLIRMLTSVGTVVGSVIVMLRYNVLLTVVFFGFVLISALMTKFVSGRTLRYAAERQSAVGRMNGLVEESYSGRMVIKAFNYEKTSSEKLHSAAEELARTSEKTDFMMNAVMPATRLINRFGMVSIAILGGGMMMRGSMLSLIHI